MINPKNQPFLQLRDQSNSTKKLLYTANKIHTTSMNMKVEPFQVLCPGNTLKTISSKSKKRDNKENNSNARHTKKINVIGNHHHKNNTNSSQEAVTIHLMKRQYQASNSHRKSKISIAFLDHTQILESERLSRDSHFIKRSIDKLNDNKLSHKRLKTDINEAFYQEQSHQHEPLQKYQFGKEKQKVQFVEASLEALNTFLQKANEMKKLKVSLNEELCFYKRQSLQQHNTIAKALR